MQLSPPRDYASWFMHSLCMNSQACYWSILLWNDHTGLKQYGDRLIYRIKSTHGDRAIVKKGEDIVYWLLSLYATWGVLRIYAILFMLIRARAQTCTWLFTLIADECELAESNGGVLLIDSPFGQQITSTLLRRFGYSSFVHSFFQCEFEFWIGCIGAVPPFAQVMINPDPWAWYEADNEETKK